MINLYAPVLYGLKSNFWDSLEEIRRHDRYQNYIIRGNFNTMLNASEKRGGSIVRDPFKDQMEDMIEDWDPIDVIPKFGKYT